MADGGTYGKEDYIFVDVFDRITFDLNAGNGRAIATLVNGTEAEFSQPLSMETVKFTGKRNSMLELCRLRRQRGKPYLCRAGQPPCVN